MNDGPFSLKVIFTGVSTHFRNGIVAGVRHRAVLPDASRFLTDSITIEGYPNPFVYYLNPHFAHIEVFSDVEQPEAGLSIPQLLRNGYVLSGVRLQVGNGIPNNDLDLSDTAMGDLSTYDPSYEYSADVVLGGRAACYFDFDFGTAQFTPPDPPLSPAGQISITVETDGYPWLLVTPLNGNLDAPSFTKLELGRASRNVTLLVKNTEVISEFVDDQHEGEFDFLFHYLTARGGIPKYIVEGTPGLTDPISATGDRIASALESLGKLLKGQADDPDRFYDELQTHQRGQTPACSPAQFG
ncbi:MAG TPA: hypothetical protein VGJ82_18720 [Thermoanaerobaculia bacterium]